LIRNSTHTESAAIVRPGATRTAVVLPWNKAHGEREGGRAAEARLAEAVGLACPIGLAVVHTGVLPLLRPRRPSTLLGEGQVGAGGRAVAEHSIRLVVVDAALTPVQQRNLERAWGCKVIDRTGLILDIFGARARTREGALQVELAHLEWTPPRTLCLGRLWWPRWESGGALGPDPNGIGCFVAG
jgi:GTPase